MLRWTACLVTMAAAFSAVAMAQPTVTLSLDSAQAGQIVPPQSTINWDIIFSVSAADNQGLALLVCDLMQNPANPAFIDLPPADGVPAPMTNFSRPDGISNPGESDPVTGYIGVQRGVAGAMNLVQAGGAQNTFGEAQPPGTGIAENAVVVGGVGQSGSETLASGSFAATTVAGTYTLELADSMANVLSELHDPPQFSPVVAASVDASGGSFSFTVTLYGDVNLDCEVALDDLAQLLANYGQTTGATWADGDLDGDGDVELDDLATLLALYGQTCP
jgi:hypothetical protein